jgi:hypothetical protein
MMYCTLMHPNMPIDGNTHIILKQVTVSVWQDTVMALTVSKKPINGLVSF